MKNSQAVHVGTLTHAEMLTGPHARRRSLLTRAEDAGLDHLFMADHVSFRTGLGMDGLIQAATAAALAPNLRVYVGVYLLALRHPVPVARQIASLAESAPGQLILGVGVGGEDRHEIEVCGVDPTSRGRRTDECLEILRGLLSGKPTSFSGEFFALEDAVIVPAPNPPVPVVIGGRADAALRRAALWGDGWLGIWSSPQRYADALERIEEVARQAGRVQAPRRNGLQLWVGIDENRDRARDRLSKAMTAMYGVPYQRFEKYSPYGTPAEIADFLAPYVEAGCREFNVMAVAENTEKEIDAVAEIRRRLVEGR
jgi:alkanesulfonate monooxygenase SsuD/methylene tetrahydromethanopterin reductase-like flavin-dependent oxidoreductase (luciferase family)